VRLARIRVGHEVELVGQGAVTESSALCSFLVQERVPQRAKEIAKVVLVAEQAGPSEQTGIGFLNEVLGILARAAKRPRGPVEPVDVISEPGGIERALHRIPVPASSGSPEPNLAPLSFVSRVLGRSSTPACRKSLTRQRAAAIQSKPRE
jgi:hypothetical protein